MHIQQYLEEKKRWVDRALEERLPEIAMRPAVIHEAMRYSVLAGGKRIRPILCLAAAEAVGGGRESALLPALAIEVLHTYTLIHDDLPALDNDALRRGKPTAHVKFGQANAILAGDALLTLAFEWLARCEAPPPFTPNAYVLELAVAAGSQGVIGGQCEDMAGEGKQPEADQVDYIHLNKTAKLIRAATRIGAMAGCATPGQVEGLGLYGEKLGMAFQVADDILNETSTPDQLGKAAGSDRKRGKMTYVAVFGLEGAREKAKQLTAQAIQALPELPGGTGVLEELARYMTTRSK